MPWVLLSNLNPGARIREIKEGSIFFISLARIREGIKKLSATSFFCRWFKKESYVPDLYSESKVISSFIRPGYLWLRAHLPCHSIRPYLGLGIVIFVSSFYNPIVSYTHLAKLRLALLLIPCVLMMGILKSEANFPKQTIFDLPLFFLSLIAIISLRAVQDINSLFFGLRELMSLGLFIMSIYLVIYTFKKKEIKRLFYLLGLSGLVAASLFIFHLLIFKSGEAYLKNTFGNPNHLAYFLVLIYPITLVLSMDMEKFGRREHFWFWRLGTVLILLAILFIRSLGVWISFFFSFLVCAAVFKRKEILVQLILLLVVMVTLFLWPFSRHYFLEQLSVSYGSTIMARIEVWKEALRSIYQRPIFGLGLGQFSASAKPYYAKEMYNAFNVFFHLAVVTGLLGLASFLWFLVRAFKLNLSILAKKGEERLYGGAMLTSLSGGLIGFLWDTHLLAVMTNWLLGFIFGSLVVMAEHNKAEQSMGR